MEEQTRFRALSVQDTTDYDPMKGAIRAKRVNYKLHDGTTSYIIVPHDQYTAENVHKMLMIEAEKHDQVLAVRDHTFPVTRSGAGNPWGQ